MPPPETTSSGCFTPPSPTIWRRERLLRIGSNSVVQIAPTEHPNPRNNNEAASGLSLPATVAGENTALQQPDLKDSYGTMPTRSPFNRHSLSFASRRGLSHLPSIQILRSVSRPSSPPGSPITPTYSLLRSQRPISAYDAPFKNDAGADPDARINGIRVWYSSFTSIDWLHDAIKNSARFARLRKRQSLRSMIRLLLDRGLGWLIVKLVGFLSAAVSFLVVRGQQWLFDLKEAYRSI